MPNAAIAPVILVAGFIAWRILFWLKKQRPVQAGFIQLTLLLLCGVVGVVALLYMALDMLVRHDDYEFALIMLLLAGLLYIPWFGYAAPTLIRRWSKFKDAARNTQGET